LLGNALKPRGDPIKLNSFLKIVALIDITIFIVITLLCEIKNLTVHYYIDFLTYAGFALVCIGVLSLLGEWGTTRDFRYQYASSAGSQTISERTKRLVKDVGKGYSFLILMSASGVILIAFAILIDIIVG